MPSNRFELLSRYSPKSALQIRELAASPFQERPSGFQPLAAERLILLGVSGAEIEVLRWVNESEQRRLTIFEPSEQRLRNWLDTTAAACLQHPRIAVHLLTDTAVSELGRELGGKPYLIQACPAEAEHLDRVGQLLAAEGDAVARLRSEFQRAGDLFYHNFYRNLRYLNGAQLGSALFDQFEGVPALICGAGPSLEEELRQVERLTDGAVVLAAGSGLNALIAAGCCPHFGIGIDPHNYQLGRMLSHSGFEVPMFYRQRWCREVLPALQAPRLYLHGAGGYPVVEWVEEQLDFTGPVLEEGPTAVCMGVELAMALGCDPIVLVGVDLALPDGKLYAPGVKYAPHEVNGYTAAKFAAEAQWLNQYPERTAVSLWRVGQGGLLELPSLALTELPAAEAMGERVHAAVAAAPLIEVNPTPVLRQLRESLIRCWELLQALRQGQEPQALYEVELLQEIGHQLILAPLASLLPDYNLERAVVRNLAILEEAYGLL